MYARCLYRYVVVRLLYIMLCVYVNKFEARSLFSTSHLKNQLHHFLRGRGEVGLGAWSKNSPLYSLQNMAATAEFNISYANFIYNVRQTQQISSYYVLVYIMSKFCDTCIL